VATHSVATVWSGVDDDLGIDEDLGDDDEDLAAGSGKWSVKTCP
jgi:hypothetical protein